MTGAQENVNTRNSGLVEHYEEHKPDIIPKEGLNESWIKFIGLHTEVNSKNRLSQIGNKGIVKSKTQAREDVHTPLMVIAGAIFSFGRDTRNQELVSYFDFQDTKIRQERDTDYLNIAKTTLTTGNLNIVNLGKYDVTNELMLEFEAKVGIFETSLGKRVQNQKVVKNVNAEIDELFSQINDVIKNELNKRMLPFKTSNPTLYNEYLMLREISDEGIRHDEPVPENPQ